MENFRKTFENLFQNQKQLERAFQQVLLGSFEIPKNPKTDLLEGLGRKACWVLLLSKRLCSSQPFFGSMPLPKETLGLSPWVFSAAPDASLRNVDGALDFIFFNGRFRGIRT